MVADEQRAGGEGEDRRSGAAPDQADHADSADSADHTNQAHQVDPALDLTSCDREPIHVPGSIQPHGFLLALDPVSLRVLEASENAAGYFGRTLESLFGATLDDLLGEAGSTLSLDDLGRESLLVAPRLLGSIRLSGAPAMSGESRAFEVIAHRLPGTVSSGTGKPAPARTLVEFEEIRQPVDLTAMQARLYNFLAANRGTRAASEVMRAAVQELRALTGCGRVVLYSFDEEGHGTVLAEDRGDEFDSYLGLRFPASDVPKQARRMYELNRVRIIPDVDYEPSPILSSDGPAQDLDLSFSVLRSVSPVHRAYMRNMGTACSMSVSILIDGRLWGLVSCHHHVPRYVPLRVRSACDFILQVVSSQIESEQGKEHLRRMHHSRAIQSRLLAEMAAREQWFDGLLANPELLMDLLHADGVAVVEGESVRLFGSTPEQVQVEALAEWLRSRAQEEVFVSHALGEVYAPAKGFAAVGSGLVAASLSRYRGIHVLWFRAEQVATVRWAGDPHKPAVAGDPSAEAGGSREAGSARPGSESAATGLAAADPGANGFAATVGPRNSFAEWSQTVQGHSLPWTSEQAHAAVELRRAVLEIVLKRAEEMEEMAAGLKTANEELEAFSYSVSHDLRAPFRHISGFSEMLLEEEAGRMSIKGRRYLDTIMDSAHFAGQLVDSLLEFARIARTRIEMTPVDMAQLIDGEWHAVLAEEGPDRRIEFTRGPLPLAVGDVNLLRQVLRNLLSNAIKYTGKVELATITVSGRLEGQDAVYCIQDNGAGFDQQYAGKLFSVFQRLHRAEEFGGTGIGLANVRRIVGRHGGRTWAEGEVGKGAAFFFTLPAALPPGGD